MEKMSRADHYARARELMDPIEERMERERRSRPAGSSALLSGDRDDLTLAQIHATLATLPYSPTRTEF